MRNKFDTQLKLLNNNLIGMGALCETAISNSVNALLHSNKNFADEAIKVDKKIDDKEKDIESLCLKLLLEQQPVARDLRQISSALKMITDMERIGDQASDIAEIILSIDLSFSRNNEHIHDMAEAAIKMVTESIDAFVKRDLDLAKAVIQYDDYVDNLFVKIRNDLIKLISTDEHHGAEAVDVIMIAKYLERIGDHAVNIAEWVIFSITGTHEE